MTDREAMKIAFHTLVNLTSVDEYGSKEEIISKHTTMGTLRQALAQIEQEPVAWMVSPAITIMPNFAFCVTKTKMHTIPLYTSPPKREWVGLTDEEIGDVYVAWDNTDGASFADFARLIETKSRSKNNG